MGLWTLFAACANPFSTRSPENPESGSGQTPIDNTLQTNPNTILAKIAQTFRLKDSRSYLECFATETMIPGGFHFVPENDESARLSNWTVQDENNYFTNFTSIVQTATIDFSNESPPTPVRISQDTLQIDFNYLITAQFRTNTERFQGRSIIRILKGSNQLWFIYEWEDLRLETDENPITWSTLKANFRYSP